MRKLLITVGVGALVMLLGFGAVMMLKVKSDPVLEKQEYADNNTGLVLGYPSSLVAEDLSGEEEGSLLRLQNQEGNVRIRVSYEKGLRAISVLTKTDTLPMVLENTEKSLSQTFPDIKTHSTSRFDLKGKQGGEIVFSYKKPGETEVKRRLVIVSPDEDTVVYIAAETSSNNYDAANEEFFTQIIDSVDFR